MEKKQPLAIFEDHSTLGVSQGYEYASDKTKQKPDALAFRTVISADFLHF